MAEDDERGWISVVPVIIACVITALWAASFLVDMVNENYDPHPSITPVMLSASGFLFGREFIKSWTRSNGKKRSIDDRS